MKIFVTGGAGRLGRRLVPHFAHQGHNVVVYDIQDPMTGLPDNVRYVRGDLRDRDRIRAAAEGIDAAVHLGAISGRAPEMPQSELFEINTLGTYNTLEAAERGGAKIVVYASSLCAIGLPDAFDDHQLEHLPIDEAHPCRPSYAYDLTKLLGEQIAAAFTIRTQIPTICFRFPLLVDALTDKWFFNRTGKVPPVAVMADYLDLSDAVRVIETGLARPDVGHDVFFVHAATAGTTMPVPEFLQRFSPSVPWVGETLTDTSPLISTTKVKEVLGFEPKVTWQQANA